MTSITIQLDDQVAAEAKALASQTHRDLADWVASLVSEAVSKPHDYEVTRQRALSRLQRGLPLGGHPLSRGEIYDRTAGLR